MSCFIFFASVSVSLWRALYTQFSDYGTLTSLSLVFGLLLSATISLLLRTLQKWKISTETLESERVTAIRSAKLISLGTMAGGIAHEINNPLSIIGAHLAVLKLKASNNTLRHDDVLSAAGKIENTVKRISSIVNGLKRISLKKSSEAMPIANPQEVLTDTLAVCAERFKRRGISLDTKILTPVPNVVCGETELSQVLLNLLNNAYDAVKCAEHKNICITMEQVGNFYEISVIDSGIGISQELKERVFEPFFTTKDTGEGTGLGLSICHSIMEEVGGFLKLDNGTKTTFIIGARIVTPAIINGGGI